MKTIDMTGFTGGGGAGKSLLKGKSFPWNIDHNNDIVNNIQVIKEVNINKNPGFTLAEVLITLGIIGVVAAMTLPTLIQKQNDIVAATKLKKMYATLNNAYKLSINEHGESQDWGNPNFTLTYPKVRANFQQYWAPYLKILKYCEDGTATNLNGYKSCGYKQDYFARRNAPNAGDKIASASTVAVVLSDGAVVTFTPRVWVDGLPVWGRYIIVYDINGPKGPNRNGEDAFYFNVNEIRKVVDPHGLTKEDGNFYSKIEIDNACVSEGFRCTAKVMLDGWKKKY